MIHAGELIKRTLAEKHKTVTWFADKMCCTRPHIYKIFGKRNLDIDILWRASCVLEKDLFAVYSNRYINREKKASVSSLDTVSNEDTLNE